MLQSPRRNRFDVRIGINTGEVIVDGDDRYGEGVNVAARLEQLALPAGICVSGKVAKEVEKKLAFGFDFAGRQKVKNIEEPIDVYHVRIDAQPRRRISAQAPGAGRLWRPLGVAASHHGGRNGRVDGALWPADSDRLLGCPVQSRLSPCFPSRI